MWADLGFWRMTADGSASFHINGVTGPDEYTTVVNNNMFTNVMARYNLRRAARAVRELHEADETEYQAMLVQLDLDELELEQWDACADGMHVAKDESLGIHLQEDRFLEREVWDLSSTPAEAFPLLLNYHPLVIYRFQVLKQADVVLALFLRGSEFTAEEKRADFEYYDPITTGDSSLSAVVQSIMAAEVGHQEAALDYFRAGLFVDLGNLHGNTSDGVHIASAGGVWNALVHGFGGMRHDSGRILRPAPAGAVARALLPPDGARLPLPAAPGARGDLLHARDRRGDRGLRARRERAGDRRGRLRAARGPGSAAGRCGAVQARRPGRCPRGRLDHDLLRAGRSRGPVGVPGRLRPRRHRRRG